MKEFSDSLPASELEHFRLNMFDYLHKYICVHAIKLNKLDEEKNQTATISNFVHLFSFHLCNEEIFIQLTKNKKFKTRKENEY